MTTEREAFEAWVKENCPLASHWPAWQAACAWQKQKDIRICESEAVLFDIPGAHKTATHCAEKIRSAE